MLTFRAGGWPIVDGPLIGCARLGSYAEVAIMAFVGLRYAARGRRTARRCLLAVGVVYLLVEVIGARSTRVRPFASQAGALGLLNHGANRSFPSRHVASAVAMAETVRPLAPGAATLMYLFAIGLGVGRARAGLHFPSDVLAGGLLGLVTGRALRVPVGLRRAGR